MSKTITITANDNNTASLKMSEPIALDDMLTMLLSSAHAMMNDVVAHAPEDKKTECRGVLYDFFNVAASSLLQRFAPEMELRPNLTAKAIMEAENRIIMEDRLGEVEAGS